MEMALDTIILIQRYVTVVLLLVSAFIWMVLRQRESDKNFGKFIVHRVYTIGVLLLLPFLIGVFTFVNEDILNIASAFLLLLIFLSMFAVFVKIHANKKSERMKDLKDLMSASKKHPIRYEFARKIVAPEFKKFKDKEEELKKKEREIDAKNKKEKAFLKVRESKLDRKIEDLNKVKDFIEKNARDAENRVSDSEKRAIEIDKKVGQINSKEKNLEKREKELGNLFTQYKKSIDLNKKKKAELDKKARNFNRELARKRIEEMKKLRLEAMVKLRERERELDLKEAETSAFAEHLEANWFIYVIVVVNIILIIAIIMVISRMARPRPAM